MDKELKPAVQLSSKQKRNNFIRGLAIGCIVLPFLLDVLCSIFTVELPSAIQSISQIISGFGMILLIFWFSRPRQEWGMPVLSKRKAKNMWRLMVAIMVLAYVVVTGTTVLYLIQQQVPLSEILTRVCLYSLLTIPLCIIMLWMIRKMLDKFSSSDEQEQHTCPSHEQKGT
jgi:hypothetical protein